MEEYEK
jgi:hypothetical protein